MKTLYFPKWFWPNNLGDACIFAVIPKLLKLLYPRIKLEVVTSGSLLPLIQKDKHVDLVREPRQDELHSPGVYQNFAFTQNDLAGNILVIYPENHPQLFTTMKANFERFVEHKSMNFVVLNYLLQLGVKDIFDIEDFYEFDCKVKSTFNRKKFKLAICPMTKTNGKPVGHPGCDGVGFRFNGPRGLESWKELVAIIKEHMDVEVYEFSPQFLGLGDYHKGIRESLYDLYLDSVEMDYAITTDGGAHHLFNLSRKPLTLFVGTKVVKPEFMQLGNAYVPDVHLECRKECGSFYSEVFGVEDKSQHCKLECEHVDPIELAHLCLKDMENVRDNRISRR